MEKFSCAVRILSGEGILGALKEFGAKRLLLVTEPRLAADGWLSRLAEAAGAEETALFTVAERIPTLARAAAGAAAVKAFRPELLAAMGTGGTLDCGKAMAWLAGTGCPVAAIPTAPGSGAEVTDFALLQCGRTLQPLQDPGMLPHTAILDGTVPGGVTRAEIAEGGFQVLTQAMEAWVSRRAGSFSSLLAREGFTIACGCLPAAFTGQQEALVRLRVAAAMAGIAGSQAGMGLCTAISRSLGGLFPVPLGRLNAVLLPTVTECNAGCCLGHYGALGRAAGMGGSTDEAALRSLQSGLLRLRRELELPRNLTQAGIPAGKLREHGAHLVEAALEDPGCTEGPIKPDAFLIRRILEEALQAKG